MTASPAPVITFRRARSADLGAVERLLSDSGLPTAGVAACINNFIVAESAGRVIGGTGMEIHGRHGLLRSAVVAKDQQGSGIGRSLVRQLLELDAVRDLESVYLLTTTAEDWFPRFGFARVERSVVPAELMQSEEFRGACPDTATVMRLDRGES